MSKTLGSFVDLLNPSKWPAYRKGLVALTGFLLQLIPALSLHGTSAHVAEVVLAGVTWLSVHLVPNATVAAKP